MPTTIQVKDDILEMLNRVKKEANVKSYDEAIRYLFKKAKRMERSHFGSLPELESFRREEIDRID
jgi:predicted CopG family antitoxin